MKELYIIRHGETELNRLGIVQGRGVDASLNDTGIAQGKAFFNKYSAIKFDKVYTSSLVRTHQTVKAFLAAGLPWEQLDGLDELACILICMHGRALRLLLCLLLNKPYTDMESFAHANTTLYRLQFDGHTFELIDSNNTSHLENLLQ